MFKEKMVKMGVFYMKMGFYRKNHPEQTESRIEYIHNMKKAHARKFLYRKYTIEKNTLIMKESCDREKKCS